MNERLRQILRESHLDVYGLGKDRAQWESTVERFANLILSDVLIICEEYGDQGKDGHYCADEICRRLL